MRSKHLTDGLADLARANQQTRDTALLRATTELFVRDLRHDRDQIRRYEELATHLLPKAAEGDRAFIAERLADCADAPKAVIRQLARDRIEIAGPILRSSFAFEPLDLLAVIAGTGAQHHRLIARRSDLTDQVKQALRLTGDPEVLGHLHGSPAIKANEAHGEAVSDGQPSVASIATVGEQPTTPVRDPRGPLQFLQLDRAARLRVLADFATRPPVRRYGGSANRLDRAFRSILGAAKIVGHARSAQSDALIGAIAEGLELDPGFVAACLADATGEPLAVLLKALRLDDVQAQQVLLLATPAGRNTATFFPLADLYAGMEASVAEAICDHWRNAGDGHSSRHEPYLAGDSDKRRAAAPEVQVGRAAPISEQSKRA